jgi:NADH dehydrogenase [ubiquinone] 1 alpha subcomplex assembly factor 5
VDQEKITVKFPDAFALMEHLRGMGESNADLSRQPAVPRDVFLATAAAYDALYKDEDGYVDATFNVCPRVLLLLLCGIVRQFCFCDC